MSRHRLYHYHPKLVRDTLNRSIEMAEDLHAKEGDLIRALKEIDQKRFYVRYGFKSLSGFCRRALKLTHMQTQRIVIKVRTLDRPEDPGVASLKSATYDFVRGNHP